MNINPKYKLRTVGGKCIIVSADTANLDGIMTLNETAEFIWHMIEDGADANDIVNSLAVECGVSENEIRGEVFDFIERLKKSGIIC